jgi:hypothetical protein
MSEDLRGFQPADFAKLPLGLLYVPLLFQFKGLQYFLLDMLVLPVRI